MDLQEKINASKDALSGAIQIIDAVAAEGGNQSICDLLKPAQELLSRDDYDVVVCGEVKQGKTSFINALLGRELLPIAVKVATSQVFRISNAATESFYLVFDNGEREAITKDDLTKYGTENGEKLNNDPLVRGRSLRWIEVNVPTAFLPENVHLLDTPGLGALYHQHALITHKYIALADAVIFIKEAKDPIVAPEIEFLKKVSGITPYVMFVQSKCDLYNEDERQALATRCEEILKKEFDDKFGKSLHFWPVSSQNLFDAAKESDPEAKEFLKSVSGYDPMLQALQNLLYRATGFNCASSAYRAAFRGYQNLAGSLNEQKKMLLSTDVAERNEIQAQKKQRQQDFTRAWGNGGSELRAVNERINQIITTGQSRLQGIFAAGGEVRQHFLREIEELPNSPGKIEEYSKNLPGRLSDAVCEKWSAIVKETQTYLCSALDECVEKVIATTGDKMQLSASGSVHLNENSKFASVRSMFYGGSMAGSLFGLTAGVGLEVGAILFPAVTLGPVGLIAIAAVGLAAVVGGVILGGKEARTGLAKSNKNVLMNYVNNTFANIQSNLCIEPQPSGLSKLHEISRDFKKSAQDACKAMVEHEQKRMTEEIAALDNAAKTSAENAKARLSEIEAAAGRLSDAKEKLTSAYNSLCEVDKQLQ